MAAGEQAGLGLADGRDACTAQPLQEHIHGRQWKLQRCAMVPQWYHHSSISCVGAPSSPQATFVSLAASVSAESGTPAGLALVLGVPTLGIFLVRRGSRCCLAPIGQHAAYHLCVQPGACGGLCTNLPPPGACRPGCVWLWGTTPSRR